MIGPSIDGSEADCDRRVGAKAVLVEFPNVRHWRFPYAKGHSAPRLPCAKLARDAKGRAAKLHTAGRRRRGTKSSRAQRALAASGYVSGGDARALEIPTLRLRYLPHRKYGHTRMLFELQRYVVLREPHNPPRREKRAFPISCWSGVGYLSPGLTKMAKGRTFGVNKWVTSKEAPGVLAQLEVRRANWGFPR